MTKVEQTLCYARPHALSPPDFRTAAPGTTAKVLPQVSVPGALRVAFSRAVQDRFILVRCDPGFQGIRYLQRWYSKVGTISAFPYPVRQSEEHSAQLPRASLVRRSHGSPQCYPVHESTIDGLSLVPFYFSYCLTSALGINSWINKWYAPSFCLKVFFLRTSD